MLYLDNSATTAPYPEVVEAVSEVMRDIYGNPSSLHRLGLEAERLLHKARETVAAHFGIEAEQIVFTSGGTESNNLAILGAAPGLPKPGKAPDDDPNRTSVRVRMFSHAGERGV